MSTLSLSTIRQNLSAFDLAGLGIPTLVLLIMAMLVLPLHPLLLDILFTFNIVVALVIVMISGRVGPVTFVTAIALRESARLYRYPEERPIIG